MLTIGQSTNGVNDTSCNGLINDNAGCAVVEWSRASYGPYFDAQGGGVFAMKWDENGIAVCKDLAVGSSLSSHKTISSGSFYRAAVPQDIVKGIPDPSNWGLPVAELWPQGCDPLTYFANHSIVFGKYIHLLSHCTRLILFWRHNLLRYVDLLVRL